MLGMNAFSEEVSATVATKEEIGSSTDRLSEILKQIKEENEKKIKGAQLELVQLMEQGDQVVKSPWSSWQFGMNYAYGNGGYYKGRGDKNTKYPYEGIFTRSKSIFGRTATARTEEQKANLEEILLGLGELQQNPKSAINNNRSKIPTKYGLLERKAIVEEPYSVQIAAGIRPRNIDKRPITITAPVINI